MKRFLIDLCILGGSIVGAIILVNTGTIETILYSVQAHAALAAFVSGIFFTSVLTTAPAVAVFGVLAHDGANLLLIAICGGAGAAVGDLLLFAFVRDRISDDVTHMLKKRTVGRIRALLRRRTFKLLIPFVAGLLVALPLPTDEFGLALLGIAKMRTKAFVILVFCFNTAGILAIGLLARSWG